MDRIHDPNREVFSVRDPHHNGSMEWSFINGKFYSRLSGATSAWNICKRFHATAKRVQALAKLVEASND